MLKVSEQQLRSWERHGLIQGTSSFSFSDLIALKALQKLRESRVPSRKIGRALTALKRKLSHVERPLSELKIFSDGRTISVQIAGQKMEALTGQMLFNFETVELASIKSLAAPKRAADRASAERQAEMYFQQGLALEETGAPIEQAVASYEKAVELNPAAAGALVNLGTIYYRQHKYGEAERHYLRAVEVDSNYPLAHYNLGNLYFDGNDLRCALIHYQMAVAVAPAFPNVYFNLGLVQALNNDLDAAVSSLSTYQELVPEDEGRIAEELLRNLKKSLAASKPSRFGST